MFKVLDAYMRPDGLANNPNFNLYRIYKNPNARDLFMKAQWYSERYQKAELYAQMGEYTLVDESSKVLPVVKTIKESTLAKKPSKLSSAFQTLKEVFLESIHDLKVWYNIK